MSVSSISATEFYNFPVFDTYNPSVSNGLSLSASRSIETFSKGAPKYVNGKSLAPTDRIVSFSNNCIPLKRSVGQ